MRTSPICAHDASLEWCCRSRFPPSPHFRSSPSAFHSCAFLTALFISPSSPTAFQWSEVTTLREHLMQAVATLEDHCSCNSIIMRMCGVLEIWLLDSKRELFELCQQDFRLQCFLAYASVTFFHRWPLSSVTLEQPVNKSVGETPVESMQSICESTVTKSCMFDGLKYPWW